MPKKLPKHLEVTITIKTVPWTRDDVDTDEEWAQLIKDMKKDPYLGSAFEGEKIEDYLGRPETTKVKIKPLYK